MRSDADPPKVSPQLELKVNPVGACPRVTHQKSEASEIAGSLFVKVNEPVLFIGAFLSGIKVPSLTLLPLA